MAVQEEAARRYGDTEEAFITTLAAQLAGIIADAEARGQLGKAYLPKRPVMATLEKPDIMGIASSSGVGIGTGVIIYPLADLDAVPSRKAEDIAHEIRIFEEALQATREDIERLKKRLSDQIGRDEQALFDVYLKILDGSSIGGEIIAEIKSGQWAQSALSHIIKRRVRQFENMEDEYIRERADDIRDLGRRLLSHLQSSSRRQSQDYPEHIILIGQEVTASTLAEMPEGRIAGVVSGSGSANSHVAIIARAMGIPTVTGASLLPMSDVENQQLIVDGYSGKVFVAPKANLLKEYTRLIKEEQELDADLDQLRHLPTETPDGYSVSLFVNTGFATDVGLSLTVGAEGVGLYRSEIPFMARDSFPTEEEHLSTIIESLCAATSDHADIGHWW